MKNKKIIALAILGISGILFSTISFDSVLAQGNFQSKRKIVVFKDKFDTNKNDQIVANVGGKKIKDLKLIGGSVVLLDQVAEKKIEENPAVLRIDEDLIVSALGKSKFISAPKEQIIPWGISQINADFGWKNYIENNSVKVGIIDTGISNSHLDLKVSGGVNTINSLKSWNDDNGHGSHVAGIVGATDNKIGVIGVAPKVVELYAIKVLNSKGSGYLSDIIKGLDWAIKENIQVVNMSLGSSSGNDSFHEAIQNTKAKGITIVAAAGNSSGAVSYPAAYEEVIAVSATDSSNYIADFSSRGSEVDLAAPGVSIYSTYKGTSYATLSGTSMAAPHATGVVALIINSNNCDYDKNLNCSLEEIQKKLQDSATDIGELGRDDNFGYGLVNVEEAIAPISN